MGKEEGEITFQYEQLRNEILQNDLISFQGLAAFFVLMAALVGAAVSQQVTDPRARLSFVIISAVVAFIGIKQSLVRGRNTYVIAAYMIVFLEPFTTHVRWEGRLQEYRKEEKVPAMGGAIEYQFRVYAAFMVVSACLAGWYLPSALVAINPNLPKWILPNWFQLQQLVGQVVLALLGAVVAAVFVGSQWRYLSYLATAYGTEIVETWEDIRNTEEVQDRLQTILANEWLDPSGKQGRITALVQEDFQERLKKILANKRLDLSEKQGRITALVQEDFQERLEEILADERLDLSGKQKAITALVQEGNFQERLEEILADERLDLSGKQKAITSLVRPRSKDVIDMVKHMLTRRRFKLPRRRPST